MASVNIKALLNIHLPIYNADLALFIPEVLLLVVYIVYTHYTVLTVPLLPTELYVPQYRNTS